MRILHFCMNAPFTEHYSYQDNLLTEYQHKLGHEVRIVTTTRTRGANGNIIQTKTGYKLLDNGVELVRLPFPGKIRRLFGKYKGLIEQMIDYKPDFVFIHGLCSFVPEDVIQYKKKFNPLMHIVADNHQDEGTTKVDDFLTAYVMRIQKRKWTNWIQDVDKVYGTTSWRVSFAQKYYGIPKEKLDVLIMGIDSDRIPNKNIPWCKETREKFQISKNGFTFISGGKLDNNKKIIESIKAFSKIKNEACFFLIFGSVLDDIKAEFSTLVENDNRIRYIGYVDSDDVWKYFYASDFGLFPGRHSVLWEEAIGCGLPCLFHRYEEKDHTEVCGNCICIEQFDEDTIYRNMTKVLENKEYYAQLKANAEKASNEFSYHTIAEKSVECCYEDKK